jgi:hypothetical protein
MNVRTPGLSSCLPDRWQTLEFSEPQPSLWEPSIFDVSPLALRERGGGPTFVSPWLHQPSSAGTAHRMKPLPHRGVRPTADLGFQLLGLLVLTGGVSW